MTKVEKFFKDFKNKIMKNSKKSQFPKIKKSLKAFLTEEEGKILKKNIKKIGLTLLATSITFGEFFKADESLAACSHTSHGSHGSHGSHSRGGWC